ncbi:hypothetical protein LXM50_01650 [Microbacterium sp. Au-Mic1]|uniref:hypothetical protein n=1 Tax=Microbacterium sp. Au-Mic1 TaxID=2906457 RepID=UPI001E4CA551|nr:hypothetical protein [Microbacterium sp. Au-Mic1]MCE4024671.1 hypothetical protein [Microbacterium sp. Au-Mic1]
MEKNNTLRAYYDNPGPEALAMLEEFARRAIAAGLTARDVAVMGYEAFVAELEAYEGDAA